jgi:TolB-like protein/Flp pilus assembly protein TadD
MFADMVGYSRQIEQDERLNSLQAAKSVELFKSLIGDYGGDVANVAGDGILAIFNSAEQAVRFAVQVQSEFRDQAVWSNGRPIQFRIGINLGEVTEGSGNVQGHCVNVAARLQQVAEPGSIVISAIVREAVRERSGITLRSLGRPDLKNIEDSIEAFAVSPMQGDAPAIAAEERLTAADLPRQPSIAVLALQNHSGDAANDHLCEGIVEDVIANLTRFRNLMVIARHSAFLFSLKFNSVREIGKRLGVRYLLAGSLRRSGKRIRIAVELIDVETESAFWSEQFTIDMEELFDLQDEIAASVASRLAVQIDFAERRQESYYPRDMRAYGLVLRGQQLVGLYTKESNAHARRLFEEALVVAPEYGRVYSALSRTHNLDWRYSWSASPDDSLDSAVALAQRSIELDPLDAHGFSEHGFANLYKKRHDESLSDYRRALALNPNDADIIAEYADALVYAGDPSQSIGLIEQAMRLNPYYPDWYLWYLADAQITLRQHAEVIATVHRMQNPDQGRRMLAACYAHLGFLEEAKEQGRTVMRLHPEFTISRWRQRPPYRDQGVLEHFIEGLRKAGLPD